MSCPVGLIQKYAHGQDGSKWTDLPVPYPSTHTHNPRVPQQISETGWRVCTERQQKAEDAGLEGQELDSEVKQEGRGQGTPFKRIT